MASEIDLTALYREHTPWLLSYLRARVPLAWAEDILHNVWVTVLLQEYLPGGEQFRPWIFRIARNAVIDYQRKASTRREKIALDPDRDVPARAEAAPGEKEELAARLRACVESLPEPFRLVVQGRLNGETPEEIAGRLNIPRATVDTRFFKAKAQLGACMGPENA
jgi:RNA polymerase sigma-70 factor, ECF subfamily